MAKATWLTGRTLTVLVNADSLLNCLILKGARKNTVLLCLSLAQRQTNDPGYSRPATLLLHWPWESRKKRHIEQPVAKHFLVKFFLVSLPPAPSFLSKHSHSDHKLSKFSYTTAVIPFWVSASILQTTSRSPVFVTWQKQPRLTTATASSSLLLHLPEWGHPD